MKTGRWRTTNVSLDNNGIFRIMPTAPAHYDVKDIREFNDFVIDFNDNNPCLVLTDMREHTHSLTRAAREFIVTDPKVLHQKLAEAVLLQSLGNILLASFYLKIHQPATPTKTFRSEKEAVQWLSDVKLDVLAKRSY